MDENLEETLVRLNADDLLKSYTDLGLDLALAKKCAIKSLRQQIDTLHHIDEMFLVGLKEFIEAKRKVILEIVER